MAFAAVASTVEPRSFSIGTQKIQIMTWSTASGDTSGTVTPPGLSQVTNIIMDGGLILNAAPTYATNVVTLAFNDPVATVYGTLIVFGR